jgi:hypothetical protein
MNPYYRRIYSNGICSISTVASVSSGFGPVSLREDKPRQGWILTEKNEGIVGLMAFFYNSSTHTTTYPNLKFFTNTTTYPKILDYLKHPEV